MPNTSEGFYYPDANTNIAPLETVLANMAASSNSVAQQTPRVFANYAAMVAGIPSPVGGRLAITTQGSGILWQYNGTAAKWVVQNRPTFSDATARDAAIPSPTAGIVTVIGSGADYAEYRWNGSAWRGTAASGRLYNPGDVAVSAGTARADLPADSSFVGMTSATGRLTVITPGIYSITASATIYSTTVNAGDYAEVRLNGVGVPGGGLGIVAGTDTMYKTGRTALILMLAAGDYLELWRGVGGAGLVTQKSGSLAAVRIG